MKKNIDNFKFFYSSFLGNTTSSILSKKISKLWTPFYKSRIAAIGFCSPFAHSINKRVQRLFFLIPSQFGEYHFSIKDKNSTASINEYTLPIDDSSLDRLLVIHSLEYITNHKKFLREAWRTLDKNGEILIIVPNSFGLWRIHHKKNLLSLRTFSYSELNSLLLNNFFTPIDFEYSLFFPTINNKYFLNKINLFEYIGRKFFKFFAGVIIVRAKKNYSTAILKEKKIMKREVSQNIEF